MAEIEIHSEIFRSTADWQGTWSRACCSNTIHAVC